MNRPGIENGAGMAYLASLFADRTRATFCLVMLDGRAWTPSELARQAGVAASTATEQVTRLVDSGLLAEVRQGRHRYVRLADAGAAELIETLAAAAPDRSTPVRSLSASRRRRTLASARTCYDHLAGTLGVSITDAMTSHGFLVWQHGLALTAEGVEWLAGLGIDKSWSARSERPAVRACLDWTERRDHLAGAAGAALCRHAFSTSWIARVGTSRAIRVTATGRQALHEHLGLTLH